MAFFVMRSFYNALLILGTPLLVVYLLVRSRKDPAYRQRFLERFGFRLPTQAARGAVLLHTVSVGEFNAAKPLINRYLASLHVPLLVTCTTPTASAQIAAFSDGKLHHSYLPFDYPWLTKRWLKAVAPKLVVVMETELWPNLLVACSELGIPVQLINARLSARSAKGYRRFYWLTQGLLARLTSVQTQDAASARRFKALGAPAVHNAGNMKFDLQVPEQSFELAEQLKPLLAGRKVWVAASTHAGEDELLLEAYQQVQVHHPELLLILVPRHKERFENVAALITKASLHFCRRSQGQVPDQKTQVWLGDSMGELLTWYQLADVAFIGGSLIERGGHNPLEAMAFAKPVLTGPHIFNFASLYAALKRRNAVRFVTDTNQLSEQLSHCLQAPQEAREHGQRGYALFSSEQGAAVRLEAKSQQLLRLKAYHVQQEKSSCIWANPDFFSDFSYKLLTPAYWQQQESVVGHSKGRNTVWFVEHNNKEWVLRHYYRGGLVGKVNKDWFWPTSIAKSRAMAEYQLLEQMHSEGLPVPRPGLAGYRVFGMGYRADILLERIAGAVDLSQLLQQRALSDTEWQQVGQMVRTFHDKQIWHSDLNCHNILWAEGRFYLIDFDKCARRGGQSWKAATLARLERSFLKELGQLAVFHYQPEQFQTLMQGYTARHL